MVYAAGYNGRRVWYTRQTDVLAKALSLQHRRGEGENLIPSAIPSHEYQQWGFAGAEKPANTALLAHYYLVPIFSEALFLPEFAGKNPRFYVRDCRVGSCRSRS